MRFSTTSWQVVAIVLAILTLALQVTIGLEHLEGASNATKASIVLVMIILALLPKFVELAVGARMFGLSAALLLAFGAWFAYSLPATVGRTGEVKVAKVAEAKAVRESHKLLLAEFERAQQRLAEAARDAKDKCRNPASDNCKAARLTETERQSRVDVLLVEVVGTKVPSSGDVASDLLAWALAPLGLSAEAIRNSSTLAFAFGLDILIWALTFFGTSDRLRHQSGTVNASPRAIDAATVSASPSPPDGGQKVAKTLSDDDRLSDIRREVSAGRHHGVVEYGTRWGVTKGESSKTISALEEKGEITCTRAGHQKLVTGIKRRLTRAA